MSADSYDRDLAEDKPAKRPRAAKKTGERKSRSRHHHAALSWRATAKIAFWGTLIAAFVTVISLARHGHAPSWRSIAMIGLNSLPLFLGLMLTWITGRWAGLHLQSRLISTGLVMVATLMAMTVFPALGFYGLMHMLPATDELEAPETLMDYIMNFGAMGYLYLATGFRYWWPYGAALPLYMGLLHWRSRR